MFFLVPTETDQDHLRGQTNEIKTSAIHPSLISLDEETMWFVLPRIAKMNAVAKQMCLETKSMHK